MYPRDSNRFATRDGSRPVPSSPEPVSYTHLDVYKRQPLAFVLLPTAVEASADALADEPKAFELRLEETDP